MKSTTTETVPVAASVVDNAFDLPRRHFLSPEFGTVGSSSGNYANFWRYPYFLITHCGLCDRWKEPPPCQKPARFVH